MSSAERSKKYRDRKRQTVTKQVAVQTLREAVAVPAVTESVAVQTVTTSVAVPAITEPVAVPAITEPVAVPAITETVSVQAVTEAVTSLQSLESNQTNPPRAKPYLLDTNSDRWKEVLTVIRHDRSKEGDARYYRLAFAAYPDLSPRELDAQWTARMDEWKRSYPKGVWADPDEAPKFLPWFMEELLKRRHTSLFR